MGVPAGEMVSGPLSAVPQMTILPSGTLAHCDPTAPYRHICHRPPDVSLKAGPVTPGTGRPGLAVGPKSPGSHGTRAVASFRGAGRNERHRHPRRVPGIA